MAVGLGTPVFGRVKARAIGESQLQLWRGDGRSHVAAAVLHVVQRETRLRARSGKRRAQDAIFLLGSISKQSA